MKHPSVFLLLMVGAILAVQLASSTQQHQNNRLKSQKPHHVKSEHHEAVQHAPRGKKASKLHHEPVRVHGGKSRAHTVPVHHEPAKPVHHESIKAHHTPSKAHHLPSKHHAEGGGKRHLEIQKPPKPFLQPPLITKHQRTAKHHGKQERNNKHR